MGAYVPPRRNTEEENNGNVVFKPNILGSAEKGGGGDVTPPIPTPFYSKLRDRYLKTT
jgi:hypothetical protein